MSYLENLSNEILMSIFEYMDIEDVWRIFFHMNTRFNSLVIDSRLHLIADISKIEKYNFNKFCLSLSQVNINNIFILILSNNYYRYPQIRQFLYHTNFIYFQSLYSLILIDIDQNELIEVIQQIKQLENLKHLNINTHEIFRDNELKNVTQAVFNQMNIQVLRLVFHQQIQWLSIETMSLSNVEILSLNFINIDRLFMLLPRCPYLRSLTMTLDSRNSLPISKDINISESIITFSKITHLCFYFRPFDKFVLERLLNSLPFIKRFSIDTLLYNSDHIRAPFWTLLLQQRLPLLERIRLVIRGWYVINANISINEYQQNLIDGYRYDRYWLDRAYRKIFNCYIDETSTVLQIR